MEQVLVMNLGGMRTLDSQIGVFMDDKFFISEDCVDALEEMQKGLLTEDKNTRYFRRFCASYDIVRKNIIPLLLSLDDEVNDDIEDKEDIFFAALKVLAHITQPLECLIPNLRIQLQTLEKLRQSESSQPIAHKLIELETVVKEIQAMLCHIKQAFSKPEPTSAIVGRLSRLMSEVPEGKLPADLCDAVDNMFFLYRNFLYQSDSPADLSHKMVSLSAIILRLLFQFGIKDLVFYCINSPQYERWTLSVIEFITLMYKDPEKTMCDTYQPCMSASEQGESADHDEQDSQYHSEHSQSTHSQANATIMADESMRSVTSSMGGESGASRTAESVRSEVTIIIVREKLKEFSFELLRNGCGKLLYAVKTLLVSDRAQPHTSMYYMWNLSFYLMMSCRFNMPFSCVRELLSVYTADYLMYAGAVHCEKLRLAHQHGDDTTISAKQIELAVTGIKYVFKCLTFYWKSPLLTEEERQYLINLQVMLVQQSDVRHLLLLLLRVYHPATHQLSYLKCVMKLNHSFLTMCELLASLDPRHVYFDMKQHISKFATAEVMRQYGTLLTHHRLCSAHTVEQVFTMMHHVATDCGRPHTLLQLPILNAFCMLEESPYRQTLSKECRDLVEYSFEQFLRNADKDPMECAKSVLSLQQQASQGTLPGSEARHESEERQMDTGCAPMTSEAWTQGELDELYQICMENEGCDDFQMRVKHEIESIGITKDLSKVDWSSLGVRAGGQEVNKSEEYDLPQNIGQTDAVTESLRQLGLDDVDLTELATYSDKAAFYLHKLTHTGHQSCLEWIQKLLLETCYILLGGFSLGHMYPEEPVSLIHILLRQSVPLVAYTEEQDLFLSNKYCRALMAELGMEAATTGEQTYPRIPHTWDVQQLIQKADTLGPVDYSKTKFTQRDVQAYCDKMDTVYHSEARRDKQQRSQQSMNECEASMWMLYIGKANATS